MHLSNSSAYNVPPVDPDEAPPVRADILKKAGDRAGAAPIGSTRGTKGAGQRR